MSNLNCVLLGASGVGKTTFLHRHVSGQFELAPVHDAEPVKLPFVTTQGIVAFHLFEEGVHDCPEPDCAMIFFSLIDAQSYQDALETYHNFVETHEVPVVVCGTHCDQRVVAIPSAIIAADLQELGFYFIKISSKSNFNYEKPLLHLARKAVSPQLKFRGAVVALPELVLP